MDLDNDESVAARAAVLQINTGTRSGERDGRETESEAAGRRRLPPGRCGRRSGRPRRDEAQDRDPKLLGKFGGGCGDEDTEGNNKTVCLLRGNRIP